MRSKEHKLDMEYATFGLGCDADVKKSVFKAPIVRANMQLVKWQAYFISWLKVQVH